MTNAWDSVVGSVSYTINLERLSAYCLSPHHLLRILNIFNKKYR